MKPQILVTPKKGTLLGAKDNQGFVDTFDWMKNVCNNIKGDGLTIEVDRKDEDAPVIRLTDAMVNAFTDLSAGGGGECDCSLTAYYESGTDRAKVATWTKGDTTVDVYSPTNDSDVLLMYQYMKSTPFFYDIQNRKITNCFFYDGRNQVNLDDYPATAAGTYYLKITVDEYGTRTYSMGVYQGSLAWTLNIVNTDSETYIKLWGINNAGLPVQDYRSAHLLPFYTS